MVNTSCCELMDIFEVSIGIIKGASNEVSNLDVGSEIPVAMGSQIKEVIKTVWVDGAKHFSFLMTDKLWKEDRLCSKCETIYHKLQEQKLLQS